MPGCGTTSRSTASWSSSAGSPLAGNESVSVWSCAVISTVAVFTPGVSTVAVIWNVVAVPTARLPMSQAPVAGSNAPPLVSPTYVTPVGSMTSAVTPLAAPGPSLLALTVKVTVWSMAGVASSTAIVVATSIGRRYPMSAVRSVLRASGSVAVAGPVVRIASSGTVLATTPTR